MSAPTITDDQGHHWPITGYWCNVCGFPLHAVSLPFGNHPICDPANDPELILAVPERRVTA